MNVFVESVRPATKRVVFVSTGTYGLAYLCHKLFDRLAADSSVESTFIHLTHRNRLPHEVRVAMDGLGIDYADYGDAPEPRRLTDASIVYVVVGDAVDREEIQSWNAPIVYEPLESLFRRHKGRLSRELVFEFAIGMTQLRRRILRRLDTMRAVTPHRSHLGVATKMTTLENGSLVSALARTGIHGIALVESRDQGPDFYGRNRIQAVVNRTSSFGIGIWSLVIGGFSALASGERLRQQTVVEHVRHCLGLASDVGANSVIIKSPYRPGNMVRGWITNIMEGLTRLQRHLLATPVTLGIDVRPEWFDPTSDWARRLIDHLEQNSIAVVPSIQMVAGAESYGAGFARRLVARAAAIRGSVEDGVPQFAREDSSLSRRHEAATTLTRYGFGGDFLYDLYRDADSLDSTLSGLVMTHREVFGAGA